jgi:hypothetical protein
MNASTSYSQGAVSILGAEPFPTTTYSLDIAAGTAGTVLQAGTLLTRAGAVAITAATTFGILAYSVDITAATSGTVYLTGSFLRDLIIAANSGATIDATFEDGLRAKGIYLERSIGT